MPHVSVVATVNARSKTSDMLELHKASSAWAAMKRSWLGGGKSQKLQLQRKQEKKSIHL